MIENYDGDDDDFHDRDYGDVVHVGHCSIILRMDDGDDANNIYIQLVPVYNIAHEQHEFFHCYNDNRVNILVFSCNSQILYTTS